jgi:DNA-binding NtrC family response regulator
MISRILVAEEEAGIRNLISLALKHQGYSADFVEGAPEAAMQIRQTPSRYSAVLVDLSMCDGLAGLIEDAHRAQPSIPIIGLAEPQSFGIDREDLNVNEVVYKPITGEKLRKAMQACLSPRQYQEAPAMEISADTSEPSVTSGWRTEMQSFIRHVAVSDVPVLVQGETGAGKEVLARQLHALSTRAKKPFLKVNCAALPSELIESELFGYERGAFTGAFKTTAGKFEMADGGTILLDEIGDMDFKLQAKLLQVLQDREFIRLGSSEPRRVDVRVMAATHCNLEQAIAEGKFREDLYYRLNIITLHVPPLRDRVDEILPLAYHFMRKHATPASPSLEVSPVLHEVLLSHDWPGNIRELENVIRKFLVIRRADLVSEDLRMRARRRNTMHMTANAGANGTHTVKQPLGSMSKPVLAPRDEVPRSITTGPQSVPAVPVYGGVNGHIHEDVHALVEPTPCRSGLNGVRPLQAEHHDRWSVLERVDKARREAETEAIMAALNSSLWNRKRAAELLNIDYKALLYKMKKLGIVERAAQIAI